MSWTRSVVTLAAVVATVACSSGSDGSANGGPDAAAPDAARPAAAPCSEPVDQRPVGSACIKTVTGRLVEEPTAQPIALLTTVCGAGLCLLAKGDPSGFVASVNRFVDLDAFVVHVDGRPTHANVFVRLARASSDAVVLADPIRVPRLDQVGPALPEKPASSTVVQAGDVALTLAAGTVVELDFADASLEAEGRLMRSGRVSREAAPDPELVVVHALAPFGAALKPAAAVAITLPASAGLADGMTVDLVALQDSVLSPDIGKLRVVGTATVSGGVARSDAATGIERLTWIGVRKRGSR
jgi:hypothetical protein